MLEPQSASSVSGRVGDIDPAELEAFTDQLGPVAKEAFVTTAEMLEARGRREGKIEGKREGKIEGKIEGRADVLLEQLTSKFGSLPDQVIATVRAGSIEQLQRWTVEVLTAGRLDEIF